MTYDRNKDRPYSVNQSNDWVWVTRASDGVAVLHQDDCNALHDNPGWRDRAEAVPEGLALAVLKPETVPDELASLVLNALPKKHSCKICIQAISQHS